MTKWAPMGLSPVSLKSLLPSFPPWRRDPSSQSVWSLHILLYRAKWALIDWICMHANEVQNGTNQKEVLNLERDWGDRWASPKCASFPTMMVVGIISYHKDVARQIAHRKSLGFFFSVAMVTVQSPWYSELLQWSQPGTFSLMSTPGSNGWL